MVKTKFLQISAVLLSLCALQSAQHFPIDIPDLDTVKSVLSRLDNRQLSAVSNPSSVGSCAARVEFEFHGNSWYLSFKQPNTCVESRIAGWDDVTPRYDGCVCGEEQPQEQSVLFCKMAVVWRDDTHRRISIQPGIIALHYPYYRSRDTITVMFNENAQRFELIEHNLNG